MNENIITSPCITVCKTDPVSGFCYGCGRSTKDKIIWKELTTTNSWKEENLKLHINFESYGRKWLVLSYAHLDFL